MRAVLLYEHGGPDAYSLGQIDTPEPGPGQARVKLASAALNRLDLWVRAGWRGLKLEYPHIPGADGAGEIDALADGVSGLAVGDRVVINANLSCGECNRCQAGLENQCRNWELLGETVRGTFAEYVTVPAGNLLHLPDNFPYYSAAAAGLVYHTAWHSLITRGQLHAGETVLVVGASGGVNTACIQIAKHVGARVLVVGSSADKLELARSLGADVLIDRSQTDWSRAAYEATDRLGVDVVVDNVGAGTMPSSLRAAGKGGRILTVGNSGGPKYELDHRFLFAKHLSVIGSTMGTNQDFKDVMGLIFEGQLESVVDRVYPLEQFDQALARLEAGDQLGKIVLEI